MRSKTLVQVDDAGRQRKLPDDWLRVQAVAGHIPFIRIGGEIFVHGPTVDEILLKAATSLPSPSDWRVNA